MNSRELPDDTASAPAQWTRRRVAWSGLVAAGALLIPPGVTFGEWLAAAMRAAAAAERERAIFATVTASAKRTEVGDTTMWPKELLTLVSANTYDVAATFGGDSPPEAISGTVWRVASLPGFTIPPSVDLFATAAHCVRSKQGLPLASLTLMQDQQPPLSPRVNDVRIFTVPRSPDDLSRDIAFFTLPADPNSAGPRPGLNIRAGYEPDVREILYALGYTDETKLSSLRQFATIVSSPLNGDVWDVNALVNHGMSGAAVLNANCETLGLMVAINPYSLSAAYVVPFHNEVMSHLVDQLRQAYPAR